MSKFRRFCLTWNNYTDESLHTITNTGHSYLIVGKEKGDSGTPHYQMYVEYATQKTFSSVIKAFHKKCHIEVAKADATKNREYCSKQEVLFEEGTPKQQGRRNDLKDLKKSIEGGKNIRQMLEDETISSYQGLRCSELLMKYIEPIRTTTPKLIWRYGATGTGKTEWVHKNYPNVYKPISFKWFDGYDGQKAVLIDDFRADWCGFADLLKFTDKYPFKVETKGGSRQFLAETIIFTCPFHLSEIYDTNEDVSQLIRRFDEIIKCEKNN